MAAKGSRWESSRHNERRSGSGWEEQAAARRIMARYNRICHVCGGPDADQVDHVIPLWKGGPDTDENKRPIHKQPCHADKSKAEASESRRKPTRFRPPERHPGMVDPDPREPGSLGSETSG